MSTWSIAIVVAVSVFFGITFAEWRSAPKAPVEAKG